jgi:membrane protease YdiL (CAAX protease family)
MTLASASPWHASATSRSLADRSRLAHLFVWAITLIAVGLPEIGVDLAGGSTPDWLPIADVAIVTGSLMFSLFWSPLGAFSRFLVVLLAMQPAIHPTLWPVALSYWRVDLPGGQPPLRAEFILELALVVALVGVLAVFGLTRRQLYLGVGQLDALAAPVRWLIDRPIKWTRLGPVSAALIGLGTFAFLVIGLGTPALNGVTAALPAILLFAAINAFNEEMLFRAAPMATLGGAMGRREAILLGVALFAVPHYFGIPFGLVGMAMAAVLAGWLLKCLLETRGLFWPWTIHFVQDILIFAVITAGAGP